MRSHFLLVSSFACVLPVACTATQDLGRQPDGGTAAGTQGGNGPGPSDGDETSGSNATNPVSTAGAQKRVFVTSRGVLGTFAKGGKAPHDVADAACAAAAADAKLGGKFIAWLSARTPNGEMVRARDRLPAGVTSWTLVDGKTVVFADRDALFSSTLSAIDQDEFGAKVPEGTSAWTGSLIGGGPAQRYTCNNWEWSLSDKGVIGIARPRAVESGDTQVYWAGPETEVPLVARFCESAASFYCFEI